MGKRTINRRGQGSALREEILDAAGRLLAAPESRGEVTLRAIAREAGIAAPSIYPHFADRDAVLDAVVSRTFAALQRACVDAAEGAESGATQVRAVCDAYATFVRERPGEYRILFDRSPVNLSEPPRPYPEGIRAFELLIQGLERMVSEGTSTSTDPVRDAQALWASLHGVLTLVPATPGFPWKPLDQILERYTSSLIEAT